MREAKWVIMPSLAIALGCGPTTTPSGQSDDGTGDAADDDDDDDLPTTSGPDLDTSGDDSDGTASSMSVCGNNIVEGDEDCDDGNTDNADGCSAACQTSGTLLWSVPLDLPSQGFAVGLDALDGQAYPAVQLYGATLDPSMLLGHVDREGNLLGTHLDPGGFSDIQFARQLVAAVPGGDAIAGYSVVSDEPPRVLARLEVGGDVAWEFASAGWVTHYATMWAQDSVFVLHGQMTDDNPELVVDALTPEGEPTLHLPTGMDPTSQRPLIRGAMLPRPAPRLALLTVDGAGLIELHVTPIPGPGGEPSWYSDPMGMAIDQPMPRAYFDGVNIRVWTQTELITIDAIDHLESVEPRPAPGDVLLSYLGGFVTVQDAEIGVHGLDNALRWTYADDLLPQYARADTDAGLFVLSDDGTEGSSATLSYFVL